MARPIITLTTDFGTSDPFVGIMKGVILRICPNAEIVDIAHDVPAQDIRAGAYLFSTSYAYFPQGTTHVIVVDPSVGTERHPIAAQSQTAAFVCPDNGLLSYVLAEPGPWKTRYLTNPDLWLPNISSTFHGRDIFAPVAAHLAAGAPFDSVGPTIAHPVTFEIREPKISDGQVLGEVIHADRYGNLITNITGESLSALPARNALLLSSRQSEATRALTPSEAPAIVITIADCEIAGLSTSYQDNDGLVALIGSNGTMEIALRNGNAATKLGAGIGTSVWGRAGW